MKTMRWMLLLLLVVLLGCSSGLTEWPTARTSAEHAETSLKELGFRRGATGELARWRGRNEIAEISPTGEVKFYERMAAKRLFGKQITISISAPEDWKEAK